MYFLLYIDVFVIIVATPDNKEKDSKAPVPRQRKGSAPTPAKLEVKKMPPIARKTTPKTTPLVSPAAETAPPIPAKVKPTRLKYFI